VDVPAPALVLLAYLLLIFFRRGDFPRLIDMIPGFIISWLTFPGVIIHEVAHELFCVLTRTRIVKVCYFRFGVPAGFVVHEKPSSVWKNILIGVGPLIVNTGLGLTVGILAIPYGVPGAGQDFIFPVLMWLAISIAMHSFPSPADAKNIWAAINDRQAPPAAKAVGTPLCGLILFGAIGSIFWLDLVYGIGIVVGIPQMLNLR
jgi:hypothetical protein